jgi:hypothetical protein
MHVSYGELARIGTEAIRMTGFTFGQADDALEGIVWTECVLGRGIALLRLADQQRPAKGWPSCSARFEPESAHIDLTGCPAYAFAARLADLAQAMAADPEAKRLGAVEAFGAFGGCIAPYVAYRLARAGNSALVYWRPSTRPAREDAPATLVMATPALDGKVSACLIAPGSEYRAATRALPPMAVPASFLESIRRVGDRNPATSILAIAAGPEGGQGIDFATAWETLNGPMSHRSFPGILDVNERLRTAIEHGVQTAPEDYNLYTALSQRIRLPNTERSKSQAG